MAEKTPKMHFREFRNTPQYRMYGKGACSMDVAELMLLALGVSMDAFAVAVCKGLSVRQVRRRHMAVCGAYFGGFQGLMPLIGYLLGVRFQAMIARIDHWIAFALLGCIGLNMLREALGGDEAPLDASFGPRSMLPMAVATSIDALAVGVTFAFLNVRILPACALIGAVTFLLSAQGVRMGAAFGAKWKGRAEAAGGAILILIGLKILIEHLLAG